MSRVQDAVAGGTHGLGLAQVVQAWRVVNESQDSLSGKNALVGLGARHFALHFVKSGVFSLQMRYARK